MKITRPKSAAPWLLAFVALGVSSMALAETANYQVILKIGGTPCATYNFSVDYPGGAPPPSSTTVTLGALNTFQSCNGLRSLDPSVSGVTANLGPFPETEQGGPSRVRSLSYDSATFTLTGGGEWSVAANNPNQPPESGTYFIYNTASVPIAATLPLVLFGAAGLWAARRLRRRLR